MSDDLKSVCRALVQTVWHVSRKLKKDNGPVGTAAYIAHKYHANPAEITEPLLKAIHAIAFDRIKTGWEHLAYEDTDCVCAIKDISTNSHGSGTLIVFLDGSDRWCDIDDCDAGEEKDEIAFEVSGVSKKLDRMSKNSAIEAYYRLRNRDWNGTYDDDPTLVQWSDDEKFEVVSATNISERNRKYKIIGTLKDLDEDRFVTP